MDENIEDKENEFDSEFKIITLGDSSVGKTSIINSFINDQFIEDSIPTFGIKFSFKILTVNKDKKMKLAVLDTGGQEKYRSLSISYFRHADVVLFVFSLNDIISFENMQEWINTFNQNNNGKNVKKMYLIGNKNDLEQLVDQKLIDEFAKKNKISYISISAKSKNKVDELFILISEELYELIEKRANTSVKSSKKQRSKIIAKSNIDDVNGKKCC